ncbi:spore germination protein [Brevibacillus ginsengisoli]|uniref:spore germination protein n=1 Tax=Brevibacillus ginsengisoli TaxID=363854 RepID=UPI003CF093F4
MPAIVGTVNVNSVSGAFNIGDAHTIAPQSWTKTFAGGGSFNSGKTLTINAGRTVLNVYDTCDNDETVMVQAD